MKLVVLRHSQTLMNAQNLIVGRTDDSLSPEGILMAQDAAKKIAAFQSEIPFSKIYSSPLKRALNTAQIVQSEIEKSCAKKIDIKIDDRIIEQDYGEFEGKSRLSSEFAFSKSQFAFPTGKTGESHFKLAQRTYNFLDDMINKHQNENILVVTHGGICRVIATYFNAMTNTEYANWRAQNCQLDFYDI